jgi:hypothetical protein
MPLARPADAQLVRVTNSKRLSVNVIDHDTIVNPWREIIMNAGVIAFINFLVFLGFSWYVNRATSKLEAQEKELISKIEANEKTLAGMAETTVAVQRRVKRFQAMQMKILSHYQKEVRFWRDTIRSLFQRRDLRAVDQILKQISITLRTYATQSSAALDLELIEAMIDDLAGSYDVALEDQSVSVG